VEASRVTLAGGFMMFSRVLCN